jgi:ribonuclease D
VPVIINDAPKTQYVSQGVFTASCLGSVRIIVPFMMVSGGDPGRKKPSLEQPAFSEYHQRVEVAGMSGKKGTEYSMAQKTDYRLIDSDHKLQNYRSELQGMNIEEIAMDFEGEFNLHGYGEKLCLIQIFDGENFVIVDPLKLSVDELRRLLDSKIVKLFFDASSDRLLLYRQYGIRLTSVLDLKHYLAALEWKKTGLNHALGEMLGVSVEKKYQRYNWMRRPIDPNAMEYALTDVKYLFELRDRLQEQVLRKGRLPELLRSVAREDINYEKKGIPSIQKKSRYQKFNSGQKKIADLIFDARERLAATIDWPPHTVLSNEDLLSLAENPGAADAIALSPRLTPSSREKLQREIENILSSSAG